VPIVTQFDYVKPRSLDDAVAVYSRHENAVLLAGGTDLLDHLKAGVVRPGLVVDIKGCDELNRITFENQILTIGACVTFTYLLESEIIRRDFPVIMEVAKTVASVGVRNRATVVGNICSAVPCMDSGPFLVAYGAEVVMRSSSGERSMPVEKWFLGPRKTALQKGEIVTALRLKAPQGKHAGCYVKLGRYNGEDLAQASVIILAIGDRSFRVVFGSVGPVPIRSTKIENVLKGDAQAPGAIDEAMNLVDTEILPITDIRASKEYRMHMAKVMLRRGLQASLGRLNGNGPAYGTSVI
jgi:CO/xanthine dehydrogenase FAD-binding subunit